MRMLLSVNLSPAALHATGAAGVLRSVFAFGFCVRVQPEPLPPSSVWRIGVCEIAANACIFFLYVCLLCM